MQQFQSGVRYRHFVYLRIIEYAYQFKEYMYRSQSVPILAVFCYAIGDCEELHVGVLVLFIPLLYVAQVLVIWMKTNPFSSALKAMHCHTLVGSVILGIPFTQLLIVIATNINLLKLHVCHMS